MGGNSCQEPDLPRFSQRMAQFVGAQALLGQKQRIRAKR